MAGRAAANGASGTVTDAELAGIAGATVALVAPDGAEESHRHRSEGRYAFDAVPEGAVVRFLSSADHGVVEEPVGQRTEIDLASAPSFVVGQVTDATGAPIAGARVAAPMAAPRVSGRRRHVSPDRRAEVTEVVVSAPGFADQTFRVDERRQVSRPR